MKRTVSEPIEKEKQKPTRRIYYVDDYEEEQEEIKEEKEEIKEEPKEEVKEVKEITEGVKYHTSIFG